MLDMLVFLVEAPSQPFPMADCLQDQLGGQMALDHFEGPDLLSTNLGTRAFQVRLRVARLGDVDSFEVVLATDLCT